MKAIVFLLITAGIAGANPLEEVNYWRKHNGLNALKADPELMRFAQKKAEYRALRGLQNGHQGPRNPPGTREGTGEATPEWGWLTCIMEETGTHAGAGLCIGLDGQRYMVLVIRGDGYAPYGRNVRPMRTAHLTPNPPKVIRK